MKNKIIIAVSVVLFAVAAVLIIASRRGPGGKLGDVIAHGQFIHVICTNPACGFTQNDYRAHSSDRDWPKVCPKCGQQTLYRAVPCPRCREYTPWKPDEKGRVICTHCGHWLNPPPGGGDGEPSPSSGSGMTAP